MMYFVVSDKHIQFTVIHGSETQKILTFKRLELKHFLSFLFDLKLILIS